jgi:hypothetical protein
MITLTMTVDQINVILNALGQRPFVEVADLIAKIKMDAEQQLGQKPATPDEN